MDNSLNGALEIAAQTDPGMVRDHNEDSVFSDSDYGLAVLADGMGGYNAGEVASRIATTLLPEELKKAFSDRGYLGMEKTEERTYAYRCLQEKIQLTNKAIFDAATSEDGYAGMGTTLVAAHFYDNRLTVAHIGDSRLYRLRGDEFKTLTRDHSLLQEQIDCGLLTEEEARFSQHKNLVTRALGVDSEVEVEISEHPVYPNDIYLLCSDGLNDMVSREDMQMTLQSLNGDMSLAAAQLVQMANDNGGRDNVSVILVKVLREYPVTKGWWSHIEGLFK